MDHTDIVLLNKRAKYHNDAGAMLSLGRAFMAGEGVTRDKDTALMWFRKAALAGNADALAEIERMTAGGESMSAAPVEKAFDSEENAPAAVSEKASASSAKNASEAVTKESSARKTAVGWKKFFGVVAFACAALIVFSWLNSYEEVNYAVRAYRFSREVAREFYQFNLGIVLWCVFIGFVSFLPGKNKNVSLITNVILIGLCVMCMGFGFGVLENLDSRSILAWFWGERLIILAMHILIAVSFVTILAAITVLWADYTAEKK